MLVCCANIIKKFNNIYNILRFFYRKNNRSERDSLSLDPLQINVGKLKFAAILVTTDLE